MTVYHTELYIILNELSVSRKLRAEYHLIGSNEHQTIPIQQVFICSVCGLLYARRAIVNHTSWPPAQWTAILDRCRAHNGGTILKPNELMLSDRYPEPIPLELIVYEFESLLLTNGIFSCYDITILFHNEAYHMDLHEAIARINSVRQRIISAKAGSGEYPAQEEIREAIKLLRADRATAASSSKKPGKSAKKEPTKPIDLDAIFANVNKPVPGTEQ